MLKYLNFVCAVLSLVADVIAEEAKPVPTWAVSLDFARDNDALAADRDRLIAKARQVAATAIVRRVYKYEDVGKFRTWLDGRARALAGCPRQSWFALAMSDYGTSRAINSELPPAGCRVPSERRRDLPFTHSDSA